ncbi:hypothetical protein BDW22DRAFT_1298383, partial [Trametopsis cervina]
FSRRTAPFAAPRVAAVLDGIRIGDDLSDGERQRVRDLIAEFADCFALSLGEVSAVPGAVHRLNIPDGTPFSTKVQQRSLTPPQKAFLHKRIDELLAADIIEPCSPSSVKCVSPITLARRTH